MPAVNELKGGDKPRYGIQQEMGAIKGLLRI
jgi:hypothetical protein